MYHTDPSDSAVPCYSLRLKVYWATSVHEEFDGKYEREIKNIFKEVEIFEKNDEFSKYIYLMKRIALFGASSLL